MLKKLSVICLFAALAGGYAVAQVDIRIGPPAPRAEHYGRPPHPGYVWIAGFNRWDGHGYGWQPGHWAQPPHPGAVWVADTYSHDGEAWHYHAGYWR